MKTKQRIRWIILAGGQGKRMNHRDKGLVPLNDKPLVEHILQRLQAQGANVAINANRNQQEYQKYAPVFSDSDPDFLGPLAGMQAAMQHFAEDWFGFVPCDTPNIPNDLLVRMQANINGDTEALVAFDGERIHPTICMIKRSLLPQLTAFLAQGERKLGLFFSQAKATKVDFSQQPNAFINLNTLDELKNFER